MARPRHKNKHIEAAVRYAESLGWLVEISNAHAWGIIYCPFQAREGCKQSVWSTPKHPENFAKRLIRYIDDCDHQPPPEDEA